MKLQTSEVLETSEVFRGNKFTDSGKELILKLQTSEVSKTSEVFRGHKFTDLGKEFIKKWKDVIF